MPSQAAQDAGALEHPILVAVDYHRLATNGGPAEHRPAPGECGADLLTLEDEHGLFEARLTPPARESMGADAGPVLILEGEVRDYFGAPGLTATSVGRPGGGIPLPAPWRQAPPARNGAVGSA